MKSLKIEILYTTRSKRDGTPLVEAWAYFNNVCVRMTNGPVNHSTDLLTVQDVLKRTIQLLHIAPECTFQGIYRHS